LDKEESREYGFPTLFFIFYYLFLFPKVEKEL